MRQPECVKCVKKGLACSGSGMRFRASSLTELACAVKDKGSRPETAVARTVKYRSVSAPVSRRRRVKWGSPAADSSHHQAAVNHEAEYDSPPVGLEYPSLFTPATPAYYYGDRDSLIEWREEQHLHQPQGQALMSLHASISPPITTLTAHERRLFSHFDTSVAPIMVVFDSISNGYRDIILPLAVQDDVVKRAVCVVAAHHLGGRSTEASQAALAGQVAIISKLLQDSFQHQVSSSLKISTWISTLVLLVGENITGGQDFIHLVKMLAYFREQQCFQDSRMTSSVHDFLLQQTRMFEFLGCLLTDQHQALGILERDIEVYLSFLTYSLPPEHDLYTNAKSIKEAFVIACRIYQLRSSQLLSDKQSSNLVARLLQTVKQVEIDGPGSHALVWVCLVAAAEADSQTDRDYFTARLHVIFNRTGFRTVLAGLRMLERVWASKSTERWVDLICSNPVLVM